MDASDALILRSLHSLLLLTIALVVLHVVLHEVERLKLRLVLYEVDSLVLKLYSLLSCLGVLVDDFVDAE